MISVCRLDVLGKGVCGLNGEYCSKYACVVDCYDEIEDEEVQNLSNEDLEKASNDLKKTVKI